MTTTSTLPHITIYTDGACNPNPGPGGWSAVLLREGKQPQELCGAEPQTTNNQMELQGAISALTALPEPHDVTFYTDSNYLRQGITIWLSDWQARGWQTSQKTDVKNKLYWQALAKAIKPHHIDWHWTKGHAGNQWNERADELARSMIPQTTLPLEDNHAVHLFTASAYSGKSKTGGWSVVLRYQEIEKSLSGQVKNTSSNQMHLQAAIEGLQALKKQIPIHLYTTSSYLKDGATMWVKQWERRNWQTKEGKAVSNREYWEALTSLAKNYNITWHVVNKEAMPPQMKQAKILASTSRQ